MTELVLNPIHLAPDDAEKRLAVDQHPHAVLFHRFVEAARLVDVFEVICKPAAAPIAYPNLNKLWVWLIEQRTQLVDGGRCELHGGLARRTELGSRLRR